MDVTHSSVHDDQAEKPNTLAHPIGQNQESSEAFARIGLVPDEVSPKKLKTGEHNQQPRPAVEPLLGLVRGEGGVQVGKSRMGGGEGCVITQTGSVGVAAPQSNIVLKDTGKVPKGWKKEKSTPKSVKRRVRGKLGKDEIIAMKAAHTDISTLLAAHKKQVEPEEEIAGDDLATLEREERMERVRLRRLEWEHGDSVTTTGGPCHQIGVGAPLHQINTRASSHPPTPPLSNETAHTPADRPSKSIMTVLHSPLIGQNGAMDEKANSISVQSRAGLRQIIDTGHIIPFNIEIETGTDTRKAIRSHGSPDMLNKINKSPMMINGRMEMFSDVSSMIIQWGEEEESLLEIGDIGGKGPRRRSQRFHELCTKFEPIVDGQDVQLDTDVRGREGEGEIKNLSGSEFGNKKKIENIIRIFGSDGQMVVETEYSVNQCSPRTS